MDYPKTLAAARKVQGAEWTLADALLDEIGTKANERRLAECAEYLKEHGIEYTVGYLTKLYYAARSFDSGSRLPWLTPAVAVEAGSPGVVRRAEADKRARAEERGVEYSPPTQRELRATRSVAAAHAREQRGGLSKPSRKAVGYAAEHAPKHELHRVADVLRCSTWMLEAKRNGERVLKHVAGTKLSAAERRELRELVAEVVECWAWVADAIENPLSDEIAEYLADK